MGRFTWHGVRQTRKQPKPPMTAVIGFPSQWGFGPHSTPVTSGMHTQHSAGGDCAVSPSVLSPGGIRRGLGPWRGTVATACCRGDRLAHTTLIQRDLPSCHRHRAWRERRGVVRAAVQGLATKAPAPAPFWLRYSTMTHTLTTIERTDSKPQAGHIAVVRGASDALFSTRERVGFRTTQL